MDNPPILNDGSEGAVRSIGELGLLELIREWLGPAMPPPPEGMGDDCALLPDPPEGTHTVVTTDSLIYRRHFDDLVSPEAAGGKLLKRNLSDLASMGALPGRAVLSFMMPGATSVEWLERFHYGLRDCALEWNALIVGGDLAETEREFVSTITIWGHTRRPVHREGGAVGDHIYVTGDLGGSLLGKHWNFTPQLREGAWLSRRLEVKAMIDLTDGLAKDLPALLPENAVAAVAAADLPVSQAAEEAARKSGESPLTHALTDGEDYGLLFIVGADADLGALEATWNDDFDIPLTRIGCLRASADYPGARPKSIVDPRTGELLCSREATHHFRG